MEFQTSFSAQFVTFTYDEASVPLSLEMNHLSSFFKRWRQQVYRDTGETSIRFFSVGEYGEKSGRPHYHALVYNAPPLPPGLSHIEQWPHGFVYVGTVTLQSINYTARYCLKGTKGEPARIRCSLRPTIGADGLRQLGKQLYLHGHRFDRIPPSLKLGGKYFPLDATARRIIGEGYCELGAVLKDPIPGLISSMNHEIDLKFGDPVLKQSQRIHADFFTKRFMTKKGFYAKL